MKEYYFVLEGDKVIGFNLTEKEKDKLFYHIDNGDGHRSSTGRSYGMFTYKCENEQEFKNHLTARDSFLTTTKNQWRDSAIDLYEELNIAYEELKEKNTDGKLSHIIGDISKVIVRVEQEHGLHHHDKFI